MNSLLKKYLLSIYSQTFFPIFLTLYTITSIIFLVKIASLTSVIQINLLELLELYSYSVPTILFYTLPISVFVSLGLALAKLSSEYELIVITSFGLNPIKILKLIFPSLLLSSILMLIISLALIPKADYMKKTFLEHKKTEASFNIKPSEYGQEFGKWLIYVDKEKNGLYENIVLFQQNGLEDTFIIAKYATMVNMKTSLTLSLQEGKVLKIKDSINQIEFKKMVINNDIKQTQNINTFNDIIEYWSSRTINSKKSEMFLFYILISLFPLISLFFILPIGYFNPRYNSNKSGIYSMTLIIIFVVITNKLSTTYPNLGLFPLPIFWLIISYLSYWFIVRKRY